MNPLCAQRGIQTMTWEADTSWLSYLCLAFCRAGRSRASFDLVHEGLAFEYTRLDFFMRCRRFMLLVQFFLDMSLSACLIAISVFQETSTFVHPDA